jgi:acyl-CoA synthetase (AMP-forming)/AMP-acid ligase II
MHTLVADHWNPDGDPATLPAPSSETNPVRWIFYTSGTTADPKGAQHTDTSALAGAIGYAEKTHVVEDDIALVAFPFTHIGGIIIGVFTPLLTGSAAVLMEAWTPQASTDLIRKHAMTLGNGAPAIHAALLAEARANPDAYKTIRAFPSGGSTKPPQLHDELMEAVPGCVGITSGYGMTEAPIVSQTDIDAPDESKRNGEGTPTRGVEMRVLDNGELVVKGPQVMRGYVDSSLDKDAFTADGWLHTGDMARFDEHGAVIITGRIKDIIIRKGENVSAKEVEDVLYAHPKVADVAVLGIPDEDRGEMVVAFIVPKDAADPPTMQDVREHCKNVGLMTQKIPERIEIIDVMPRNPSGKVPKHELRARIV